ncbi:trace amine-associated receptor 6-like [Hoplias malabaricus]|uniref:trace amine-associated receptor 6-like n=1 Tax=Hoplias malabaricus TaxID=27720 RepID=UPI0034619AEE
MDDRDIECNITVQYCFPDNNASCVKEVRTGPAYIFLFIVLSCISVCTVFLNLLVIISISHFKQLHTPTNLIILSLAAADLLVGLIVMPVNIMQLIDSCWYLGNLVCSMFSVVSPLSMLASVFSLVLIAVDRYIAVCDPLLYPSRVTIYKMSAYVALGWSFGLLYTIIFINVNDLLPPYTTTKCYGECFLVVKHSLVLTDLVISLLTPCSVILVLYGLIFKVARRQAKAVKAVKNGASNKKGAKVLGSSQTKAAKKLSIIIFVYLACWIPFYLSPLSSEIMISSSVVWTVFGWLMYINSSVNPLIYAIFYSWFRESTKYILSCRIFQSSSSRFNLFPEDF